MYLTNLLTTALMLVSSCALAAPGLANLSATVRVDTGEFRFTNNTEADCTLVLYSISQPDPDLLVSEWLHVAELRDAAGDGSVDSTGTWLILEPQEVMGQLPATAAQLAEGTLGGTGAVLAPGEYLYLGAIWDNSTLRNVQVEVSENDGPLTSIAVSYVPEGDYNEDGLVDNSDYLLWKQSFGQSGVGLLADGNADQQVNLADYALWRNNLGAVSLLAESVTLPLAAVTSIPEPGTSILALGLLALLAPAVRRMWS